MHYVVPKNGVCVLVAQCLTGVLLLICAAGCDSCLFPYTEHRDILVQGRERWNNWRADNPNLPPTLACLDLSGMNLAGFDLSKVRFDVSDLTLADLSESDLSNAVLSGVNLQNARLTGADLTNAALTSAMLFGADLSGANLDGVQDWETIVYFDGCDITGVENAPEGFRELALERGAVESDSQ